MEASSLSVHCQDLSHLQREKINFHSAAMLTLGESNNLVIHISTRTICISDVGFSTIIHISPTNYQYPTFVMVLNGCTSLARLFTQPFRSNSFHLQLFTAFWYSCNPVFEIAIFIDSKGFPFAVDCISDSYYPLRWSPPTLDSKCN